jgi:hypothetical protein
MSQSVKIQIVKDTHYNLELTKIPSKGSVIHLISYSDLESGHEHDHYLEVLNTIHHLAEYPDTEANKNKNSEPLVTILCKRVKNPLDV